MRAILLSAAAYNVTGGVLIIFFLDEIGPVYALFTLWFVDNGVSAAQISGGMP